MRCAISHIALNLKRKPQFENHGVRRLAVSAANPNNPLHVQGYGLLGFTKGAHPNLLATCFCASTYRPNTKPQNVGGNFRATV